MNGREFQANKSFEAQNGIDAFHSNINKLLNMDRSASSSWPKSLLRFQDQLIKIGLNTSVDESWAPFLELEEVDSPHHVAESVTNGLRADNFSRFAKTSFFPKRRRTVVDDSDLIDHLEEYLVENCPLGIRSRDVRRVPGREEPERVRIVTDPWNAVFDRYNLKREEEGLKQISNSALRLICRNHLPYFRRAKASDREYAQCSECTQLNLHLEVINKNPLFEEWTVNKEQLLRYSICDEGNYNCLWGSCVDCDEESTLNKLVSCIPNYEDIKDEDVEYAMMMSYEAKKSSKTKTTVWVNQMGSVEEFVNDLNNSLFTSQSKGTGKKVSLQTIV